MINSLIYILLDNIPKIYFKLMQLVCYLACVFYMGFEKSQIFQINDFF